MSVILSFYLDAALTTPVTALAPAELAALVGASADRQLWLGGPAAGLRWRDLAAPGSAQIYVQVDDADPATGQPATAIRLALTQAGLDAATPGAALAVGTEILSGVGNAMPLWVRWAVSGTAAGVFEDVALETSDVDEQPV